MIINHNKEKLYNAIIYFLKNTKNCGKTKLMKLLYFLDFFHFRETGKSVTGLKYYAWQFGPYPVEIGSKIDHPDKELKENIMIDKSKSFTVIKPKKNFDDSFFSKREMTILENVAFIFQEAQTKDMVEVSHMKNEPWHKTLIEKGEKAEIDYMLSVENPEKIKEIYENLQDREEIEKAFRW